MVWWILFLHYFAMVFILSASKKMHSYIYPKRTCCLFRLSRDTHKFITNKIINEAFILHTLSSKPASRSTHWVCLNQSFWLPDKLCTWRQSSVVRAIKVVLIFWEVTKWCAPFVKYLYYRKRSIEHQHDNHIKILQGKGIIFHLMEKWILKNIY